MKKTLIFITTLFALPVYGAKNSIVDTKKLVLLAEGLASTAVAGASAIKCGHHSMEIIRGDHHDLFVRLASVLGWAYATRKLAPHAHKCLDLNEPKREDKVETSDHKATAFAKATLAAYIGLLGGWKAIWELEALFWSGKLENAFKDTPGKVITCFSSLGLGYSALKLLPYSYHKLKEALG